MIQTLISDRILKLGANGIGQIKDITVEMEVVVDMVTGDIVARISESSLEKAVKELAEECVEDL